MKSIFFISLVAIVCIPITCCEFLYPVASYTDYEQQNKIMVLYQKTVTNTELWSWDPSTGYATKMLPSCFSPAGVRMLPGDKGFSFIDNGRIRIKEFIKRSARAIDIQESLSNIGLVAWHTNGLAYFHAKERQFYAIFSLTIAGDIERITQTKTDCMYPSCVDGTLFYIERIFSGYRIFEQSLDAITEKKECSNFQNRPIAFLKMISINQGFVLEHASKIDTDVPTITFLYHNLVRDHKNIWNTSYLFSFSVPSSLLDNESNTRLYESIMPLLPRLVGSNIYYVDSFADTKIQNSPDALALYTYNLDSNKKAPCLTACTEFAHPLIPFFSNSLLFFGGLLI